MKVLQLCCFTNLWPQNWKVTSIDKKTHGDVMSLDRSIGRFYDLVVAAPPCTQFTKANSLNWKLYPENDIDLALRCFEICRSTDNYWMLENPPGRIESFIPELTKFRNLTWSGSKTNKEYVVYSNFLILNNPVKRYGKLNICRSKLIREQWQPDFVRTIINSLQFA